MVDRVVTKIEWGVVLLTFPLASLLAFLQVVLRWVSKFNPEFANNHTFGLLQWSPELIGHLLIAGALVGASLGIKTNTHIGVDVIVDKLPRKMGFGVRVATHIVTIGFLLYVFYYSLFFVLSEKALGLVPDHLPGKIWLYHCSMVLALLLMAYRFSQKTIDLFKRECS